MEYGQVHGNLSATEKFRTMSIVELRQLEYANLYVNMYVIIIIIISTCWTIKTMISFCLVGLYTRIEENGPPQAHRTTAVKYTDS